MADDDLVRCIPVGQEHSADAPAEFTDSDAEGARSVLWIPCDGAMVSCVAVACTPVAGATVVVATGALHV